ncbi:MAG: hypothetical protein DBX48_08790 [Limosilactobacillus fermentum]|nr:MAG: hypothetical protein DBX48_08790 [Limosilactobacillus fermentum]
MTGEEVREILKKNGIGLVELADNLGITNQALNSRFYAKVFKPEYLAQINEVLGRDLFGLSDTPEKGQKILDIRVCAGSGIGLDGNENKVLEFVNIPAFKGSYGLVVYGESMYDKYKPGDVVFVNHVTSTRDIDFGRCYVVITPNDRLLKSIYQSKLGDEYLRLCSYNTKLNPAGDREYPDRDINKNDILYLYKVVGRLEREQL